MEDSKLNISINHDEFFSDLNAFIKEFPNFTLREREVIKRRFGLYGSKNYTLDEIGHSFGVTRERIRQNEVSAIEKICDMLSINTKSDSCFSIDINKLKETSYILGGFLKTNYSCLTEEDLIQLNNQFCLGLDSKLRGILHLCLKIYNFSGLPESISGVSEEIQPTWINESVINRKTFDKIIKIAAKAVRKPPQKLSLFELKIEINKKAKENISKEQILFATKVCKSIETIIENDEIYFQIKFDYLSSIADKAYRVLINENQPLHLKPLLRELNHLTVKSGRKANINERNLQQQLVADSRFIPIGRSGEWKLKEWTEFRSDSIVDAMKEFFHHHKQKATIQEISNYVLSIRPNASKKSIQIYLATKPDFVRVSLKEYELSAWGQKPYQLPKRKERIRKKITKREVVQNYIREFLIKHPNQKASLEDVWNYVSQKTDSLKPTFYRYLSEMEDVQKELRDNKSRSCYLVNEIDKTVLSFSEIENISDVNLKSNLQRAINNLNIESVDMGLFYFGKIFETELKKYLTEVQNQNIFPISSHDLSKLAFMIDCLERNNIIAEKHTLTFLRQERNERAHGVIPSFEERQTLMKQAPYLAGLFIHYTIFLSEKRYELTNHP